MEIIIFGVVLFVASFTLKEIWQGHKRINAIYKKEPHPYPDETEEWKIEYQRALLQLNEEFPTEDWKKIMGSDKKVMNNPTIVSGSFNTLLAPGLRDIFNEQQNRSEREGIIAQQQMNQYSNDRSGMNQMGLGLSGLGSMHLGNALQGMQNQVYQQQRQTELLALILNQKKIN
jgi:hypothetical protein